MSWDSTALQTYDLIQHCAALQPSLGAILEILSTAGVDQVFLALQGPNKTTVLGLGTELPALLVKMVYVVPELLLPPPKKKYKTKKFPLHIKKQKLRDSYHETMIW